MSTTPRNKHLSIRFTPKEKEMINRAAALENRTAADFARLLILAHCQELPVQDEAPQEAA